MKSKIEQKPITLKANCIDDVFAGETCPYCGQNSKKLLEHISKCPETELNRQTADNAEASRWAMHEGCGKVMVLDTREGLALIESDYNRYVVPIKTLRCGHLSRIIEQVEDADLTEEESTCLINVLRIRAKDFNKSPGYPELTPGCRIEVKLGDFVKKATIKARRNGGYLAVPDGTDIGVNITTKHIVRLI